MTANTRTNPDGTWVDGFEPPPEDWEDLERKIRHSWNGDRGGVYRPNNSSYWTIAGSGLQVTGPTRLTYGGAIKGGAGAFVIPDGTWPELGTTHNRRTRSIVCPIWTYSIPPASTKSLTSTKWGRFYLWAKSRTYGGVGSVALSVRGTNSRTIETPEMYTPLRVIDGATLNSVRVYFRVATKRIIAPIAMPKMRVLRIAKDTGGDSRTIKPVPLKETADGSGFDFLPLVVSPDEWYQNGEAQSFDYVCDQNHTIDVENYDYVVHLIEEQGSINPNDPFDGIKLAERKADVRIVGSGVTPSGTQTIDGIGTLTDMRILVVDTDATIDADLASSTNNGIYAGNNAGAWTRATDCDSVSDFTPNWIVLVTDGDINEASVWQCQFPSNSNQIEFGKTEICIQPAEPKGNIYHSFVPTFTVEQLSFQ